MQVGPTGDLRANVSPHIKGVFEHAKAKSNTAALHRRGSLPTAKPKEI
jgi:hypothetical protein